MASGPADDPNRKHLFVVLTEALGDPPAVLMASISSVPTTYTHDASCELRAGDHSFVTHDSFIRFDLAKIIESEKLIHGVDSGVFIVREPVSEALYARICAGLKVSPNTSVKVRNFLLWHENL